MKSERKASAYSRIFTGFLLSCFLGASSPLGVAQSDMEAEPSAFGGTYQDLLPGQKRLIDDWVERLGKVTGRKVDPPAVYNDAPISLRTTFEAVTHALHTTALTDGEGNSLGTALDLVSQLETVRGEVKGAGGDHQFRLYVLIRPDTIDILTRSEQFGRGPDNTVYHKGYPTCFRQAGGTPSIQVSISKDGRRADMDVDYRSSKFPAAIFNGHLTAANSDVRAGNNVERHDGRWQGLREWWDNWFGLPVFARNATERDRDAIPLNPRAGKKKIQEAAYDFLKAWLIDKKANEAVAYFSERSFECAKPPDGETSIDRGMVRYKFLVDMAALSDSLGPLETLEGTVHGVRLATPYARAVRQPRHSQFVLYDVPEDRGAYMECANATTRGDYEPKENPRFGRYFATVFYVQTSVKGATVYLLWSKEDGNWKIVSYLLDRDEAFDSLPDLRPTEATAVTVAEMEGDPDFVQAASTFVRAWLLDQDIEKAFSMVSSRCYPCINLFLREGETPKRTEQEMAARIREGMERAKDLFSGLNTLSEAIRASEAVHPDVRVVPHEEKDAYLLLGVPDQFGETVECSEKILQQGVPESDSSQPLTYGKYYAMSFQFEPEVGSEPATLQFLWSKEEGSWKVIAYRLLLP